MTCCVTTPSGNVYQCWAVQGGWLRRERGAARQARAREPVRVPARALPARPPRLPGGAHRQGHVLAQQDVLLRSPSTQERAAKDARGQTEAICQNSLITFRCCKKLFRSFGVNNNSHYLKSNVLSQHICQLEKLTFATVLLFMTYLAKNIIFSKSQKIPMHHTKLRGALNVAEESVLHQQAACRDVLSNVRGPFGAGVSQVLVHAGGSSNVGSLTDELHSGNSEHFYPHYCVKMLLFARSEHENIF